MMASCLSKLHSDPTFSIVLFSPLGPQTGSGAVPRSPETPRNSSTLRDQSLLLLLLLLLLMLLLLLLRLTTGTTITAATTDITCHRLTYVHVNLSI